jgi:hypothetical protein
VRWYERKANMPPAFQEAMHDRELVESLQVGGGWKGGAPGAGGSCEAGADRGGGAFLEVMHGRELVESLQVGGVAPGAGGSWEAGAEGGAFQEAMHDRELVESVCGAGAAAGGWRGAPRLPPWQEDGRGALSAARTAAAASP